MASRKLKAGDIVFCERNAGIVSEAYQHYGVYIGYKKIIHYVKGDHAFDGVISTTSIDEFCKGDTLYIAEEDTLLSVFQDADEADNFYGPRKTVERAKSMLGTKDYDLIAHNCEHFAIWCKTGQWESTQASIGGVFAQIFKPSGLVAGTIFRAVRDEFWRVKAEY